MKTTLLSLAILIPVTMSMAQLPQSTQTSVVLMKSPGNCAGTGFFIDSDTILTASHVAQTVRMEVWISGKRYYATVSKRNDEIDYAELRISGYSCPKPLKTAPVPAMGTQLYSYGYPATGRLSSANGILGFKCGFYYFNGDGLNGMSGGPVVNAKGLVVGMTTNQHWDGGTLFRTIPK